VCEIIARPAEQSNPLALLAGDYPEAIMLDFVQPQGPDGGCGAKVGR
jgi:hypothetical protein